MGSKITLLPLLLPTLDTIQYVRGTNLSRFEGAFKKIKLHILIVFIRFNLFSSP